MNSFAKLLFAASLTIILAGCKRGGHATGSTEAKTTEPQTIAGGENGRNIREVYLSLPTVDLPIVSNQQAIQYFQSFAPIGETDFRRLTDIGDMQSSFNEAVKVFRLPQTEFGRYILTGSVEQGEWTMDMFSLSEQYVPTDRLRIYSAEHLSNGKSVIRQSFTITRDYHIVVSKYLNGTLIEQMTYSPAEKGAFRELRNGKTTTVAFDSYDGINYFIHTFIWEYSESGGLIQKKLQTENYRMDRDGNLIKSEITP